SGCDSRVHSPPSTPPDHTNPGSLRRSRRVLVPFAVFWVCDCVWAGVYGWCAVSSMVRDKHAAYNPHPRSVKQPGDIRKDRRATQNSNDGEGHDTLLHGSRPPRCWGAQRTVIVAA